MSKRSDNSSKTKNRNSRPRQNILRQTDIPEGFVKIYAGLSQKLWGEAREFFENYAELLKKQSVEFLSSPTVVEQLQTNRVSIENTLRKVYDGFAGPYKTFGFPYGNSQSGLHRWVRELMVKALELGYSTPEVQSDMAELFRLGESLSQKYLAPNRAIQLQILEDPLTTKTLATVASHLTQLYTKCILLSEERIDDFVEYSKNLDSVYEEFDLRISKITYNSPAILELVLQYAPAVGSFFAGVTLFSTLLSKTLDSVWQVSDRKKAIALQNEKTKNEIENRKREADFEYKKQIIDYSIETTKKIMEMNNSMEGRRIFQLVLPSLEESLLPLKNEVALLSSSDQSEQPPTRKVKVSKLRET